jgi:hypothetical protein
MNKDSEKSTLSNKNQSEKKNEGTSSEDDIYFYIMTLQADGERHQIKIFKNSNASELAFNFCKTYNMDFQTMKYLKKCIKKIILNFDNKRKNEMIYLLKDNSSIQEVAEEEIITDNSLKKSGTYRKTNSKNTNNKNENANLQIITNNNIIKNKLETKNIIQKLEDVDKEKNIIKSKNSIETDDKINSKDYSIDYCLENDSIEVFQPTEHTTKIEQRSSIKNSSSINKNKGESKGKKMNSKNKKLQIINNNALNMNRINKNYINCPFILGKNNRKISTNELKHLIHQYTEKIPKEKSQSKSKEKNENLTMRKKNYLQYTKKNKSLEKLKIKGKISFIDNRKNNNNILKYKHNNIKSNKYDKFLTNMNEMKNKYFSNYYDYFIKTKIINNGIKYQNSYSINQDSNRSRSKSISQQKMKKNLTQRINIRNKTKKEKSNISNTLNTISSINHQKINNNISKLNLNTILKKEGNSKEKKRTVFKNQIKTKFSIILNKNHNIFNKTILTSRNKNKNMNGKELFLDNKKKKKVIRKMVTESLLNIHKQKENNKDKRKNLNICLNNKVMRTLNNISKNSKSKEGFLKNNSGINKSINFVDKLYFDSGN